MAYRTKTIIKENYSVETKQWEEAKAKTITFIVTKGCQLACKYCYLIGKNNNEPMSIRIAKRAIDYILNERTIFNEPSIIWEFIGGEPLLEIDLIDEITDYIKINLFKQDHPWFNSYRFSFSTNGLLYNDTKIQNYIEKNRKHLSIGISIDGTEQKHDLQRVYPNGKGSYKDVIKNIPLWLEQFPDSSTKVTVSSADLPFIKESVLHLWNLGIKGININVVFENSWKEGDNVIFENQLTELADIIIEKEYYKTNTCSFFTEHIGKPLIENNNWCGAGRMLSIDAEGNFYPCTRFAGYSLRNKKPLIIGNVSTGIDLNKLRPFYTLDRTTQSTKECIECEVATGCAPCQAENYDSAETSTIFQRSTAICKMHKARVRANNYYQNKLKFKLELEELKSIKNPTTVVC